MASLVEMPIFQGNAGLPLPAGVSTVVATVPLQTSRKVSPQIQATCHIGIRGGAVATQVEVTAQIVGSAGAVVATAGAFVDVNPGENVSIDWVCTPSAALTPDGYSVVVTANPVVVPGAVADCSVQPHSNEDAVFVSVQVFG